MKAYIRLANSLFGVFPPSMKNEDEPFGQPRPFWERGSSGRTSCLVRLLGQPSHSVNLLKLYCLYLLAGNLGREGI